MAGQTSNETRKPLFVVSNKHVADGDAPPHVDGDVEGRYVGYFENDYGEQAVFIYDYQANTGTLWMGDAGWERAIPVVEGVAENTNLDEAEALCLRACWLAATNRVG